MCRLSAVTSISDSFRIFAIAERFASIPFRTLPPAFGFSRDWSTSTIPVSGLFAYSSAS